LNYFKTLILLAAMTALFMLIGYLIGGQAGMIIAFGIAFLLNIFSYWNSDKIVLRMNNAEEVDRQSAPEFHDIVRRLAESADLPMPRTYLIDNPQPNAFATGRNPEHAAVAATTGLLDVLSAEEVAGVMAHELAHVKNRDTLTMTITATLAGAISMLANFALFFGGGRGDDRNPLGFVGLILVSFLAPMAAAVVQMAISRTREYSADRLGAEICGRPLWLASALDRIQQAASHTPNMAAERNPSTAHMFIINPLSGQRMDNLFSTHPNTENRIAQLVALAEEWGSHDAYRDKTSGRDGSAQTGPGAGVPTEPNPGAGGPWARSGNPSGGRDKGLW